MVTNTTAKMEVVETGEKRDRVGRKITPAARREELVGAWERSGLTQTEFARREGVQYQTFASWVQQARVAKGARPAAAQQVRFAEVQWPANAGASALEVRLPDGTHLRGGSAAELAKLVRALRA
jgi:transposase-like protein